MSQPYREELVLLTQVTPKAQLGRALPPIPASERRGWYGPTFFLWSFVDRRSAKFHFNDIHIIYVDKYCFKTIKYYTVHIHVYKKSFKEF